MKNNYIKSERMWNVCLTYVYRMFIVFILLFTLGVGQMWADAYWPYAGFYEVYMTYSYSGNNSNYTFYASDNNSSQSVDLGTLTADFKVTALYMKCYKNTNDWGKSGNICGALMNYNTGSGDNEFQPSWSGYDDDKGWHDTYQAHKRELSSTTNQVIASYNSGASGSYTAQLSFKMWGSDDNGSDCGDIWWISNNSNNYKFKYKIAPPALNSFTITPTGKVAGSGTSGDPYIIPYGGDLTLVSSGGTKARTDDNSSVQFSLNNSTWGTTSTYTTTTIENITSTSTTSVNLYARCKNNSDASLLGAVKTQTIYYRAAALNTITLNKGTGGTDAGSMTIREYATAYTNYTPATKTGWSLKGYYTAASDGTQIIDANGNLLSNKSGYTNSSGQWIGGTTTLYAQWKQTYAVTYYANFPAGAVTSGSVPTDANEYANGATVTVKSNSGSLAATGYTFTGWNTAPGGGGTSYAATGSATFSISGNTGLYAQWNENLTTVTININTAGAGTLTVDASAFTPGNTTTAGVATNHTVVATAQPGYIFSSWGRSGNATGTSSTNTYTLKGNGSGSTGTLTANFSRTYAYLQGRMTIRGSLGGSKIHIASSEGGWDESSNRIKMDYDATNHRFYRHTYMTPKELSTEQSGNEQYFWFKTSTSSSSDDTNPVVHRPSTGRTLTAMGIGNKKETGSSTGSNSIWFDDNSTTNGYAIIYFDEAGVWYEVEHSLIYNNNGGSGSVTATACYLHGTNATAAGQGSISKSNFSFAGWNTNQYITGTSYAASANVPMNANTTLYAKWTRSITLNQNGATTDGSSSVTATYNCATLPSFTNPSKLGYTFGGWYTANDGSGLEVINASKTLQASKSGWTDASGRFTRTDASVTLYAKWTQTITLDYNSANHGSGSNKSASVILNATALSSITHCTPATGYQLEGYYTAATGGTKILDANGNFAGSNITVDAVPYISSSKWVKAGATTLYAHYTPVTYTVSLTHGEGGSGSGTATIAYDASSFTTFSIGDISQTGYHISGWYLPSPSTTQVLKDDHTFVDNDVTGYITSGKWSKAANCTLQAWWDPNNYTVTLDKQSSAPGHSTDGSVGNQSVYYNTALPSISGTAPTAINGWAFMGFYTATGGEGVQVIDANLNWVASVDGYTDADSKWKHADNVTLYAYYKKAEITGITFSTAGVPGSVIAPSTSTTATATISPTPTGTTTICWRILHSNGNPLEEQPTFDPETGAAVSFTTSATSGSYLIEARLRLGFGCNGTVLDSVTSVFQVAGDHNVTVQYKDASGNTIKASEIVTGRPLAWSSAIEAPEIFGYTFDHWKAGDGITLSENGTSALGSDESDEETIYIKAVYDGRLTAVYNQNKFLYLDLSQQFSESGYWSDPWVYFYNGGNPWDASNGVGAQDNGSYHSYYKEAHAMTQIGTSKIWYFDYSDVSSSNRSQYIAFTWGRHDGQKNFNATDVIFRGDFNEGTPLFVPITGQTATTVSNTSAKYYNAGYWVKYLGQQTGYTLEIYNEAGNSLLKSIAFANEGKRMPMIATADLEAGKTYKYQLKRDDGIYYGNNSTMNNTNHGQTTPWAFTNDPSFPGMCGLQTTAAGEYTFHLTYSNNGGSFNLRIAVDYPIAQGDYRLLYKDNVHKLWHPSAVIPSVKAKDTVSFFVRTGKAANLKLQKCTGLGDGTVTWSDTVTWWNGSTLPSAITKDSVYNICLKHNATTGKLEIENVEGYSGNYYIRTDAANNKWDNYKAADHMMTYSEYSEHNSDFSHYWMAHVTATSSNKFNVKYVVANDYSPCISDTLIQSTYRGGDSYHVDASGFISVEANIRFMWKRSTNEVYRAYLAPAQSDGSKFLVLRGQTDDNLRDVDGNYLRDASNNNHLGGDYCMQFVDNENWIYETTVKVIPSSYVKLFALFNTKNFYYKGANNDTFNGSDSGDTYHTPNAIQLITGSGEAQLVRVIYDFKTDRLVAAYLPSGNITEDMDINADVMFIREHQGDIDQLTFNSGKKLTDVKTAYGVIRFNKWTLNNKEKTGSHTPLASPLSRYERDLFYISFPFRVNLNEVFGFGTYGVHWIIEYYDGAGRAEKGFWKDSPTFWKFVTNRNGFILEPNVGYLLALDLDQLGEESAVWNNRVENVELFFPSTGNIGSITSTSVTHNLPQHECTIIRPTPQGDRHIADSHWNIMSVPTYVNVNNPSFTSSTWTTTTLGPKFLYTWNSDDNTLTPTTAAGFNYHAMHAYTVQYYGNVTWTASTTSPIVARKLQEPSAYEWCLELQQNDKMIDRTYVRMSDEEEVTTGFEFGYDMSKSIEWAKANIYTFIGTEWVAGNSLPLETEQTTIIPVGLTLAAAGDYTFAMPAGTHGVGVTLVDTQTNERTNLSAGMTQTVTLTQGDHLDRFFLEISPIHNAPTDIGLINGENGVNGAIGARKVLIDGILYIVKGDKLYDVRGTMIK